MKGLEEGFFAREPTGFPARRLRVLLHNFGNEIVIDSLNIFLLKPN
jgi:hypothetical protein